MRGVDSAIFFSNAAAGTSPQFALRGGRYELDVVATGTGGTVLLQRLGPDGATYLTVTPITAALTAAGTALYDLPPGNYQLTTTVLAAVSANITRVPGE